MSELKRAMGLSGLTLVAAGACIGSGIFMTPSGVAAEVPHPRLILAVWILGGLITLTGSLTFAELGSMFPKAGGVYIYIRNAFGAFCAFLYGWVFLTVINTGALAALGIAFADFLTVFIPMEPTTQIWTAAVLIIVLSQINVLGINVSQWLISGLTGIKIFALLCIVGLAIYFSGPGDAAITLISEPIEGKSGGLFVALVGVLWSFGGWYHATFLAGETINPKRNVPRALILGTLIVTFVYVTANWAYLKFLSMDELISSKTVAADAVNNMMPYGGKLIAAAVIISIVGDH